MKHLSTRALLGALVIAMAMTPMTSFAQDETDTDTTTDAANNLFSGTSSTTSLIIALPLTTTAGVVVLTSSMGNAAPRQAPRGRQRRAIQMYLQHHQDGVVDAQAMGAGAAVTDLAALFGVPTGHEAAMGLAMRAERERLDAILMTPCTGEAACTAIADQWIDVAFASLDRTLQ